MSGDKSKERMRRWRQKKRKEGSKDLLLWVDKDQIALLDRICEDQGFNYSQAARFLMFKTGVQMGLTMEQGTLIIEDEST